MNKKYILNSGGGCIVTSSEIEITPLHGTRPMHPVLSKKLYDQNAIKYIRKNSISGYNTLYFNLTCSAPPHADLSASITTINKYTIVELTYNNKHYHGLASRADCDNKNAVTGIAVAYHRAFDKMMQHPRTNGADESPIKKTAVDDGVDFFKKHQESKAHFRKCLLGTYGVTDD